MTPIETLKQSDHLGEKYVRVSIDFPNMAGELTRIIAYQKRQAQKVARLKQPQDVQDLLSSVGDSVEVSEKLLAWMHETLKEIAQDAQALAEGSKVRTQLKYAQEFNQELLDAKK